MNPPMNPNSPLHGSSPSSSATITPDPEPVGNLPLQAGIQIDESPEERVPTPFPTAQTATNIQLPAGILPMNLQTSGNEPLLGRSLTNQSLASQPSTNQPTNQPSTSQASTSQASTSQASTSQPSTSQASTSQASTSQASTSQASTSQPSTSQTSTSQASRNQLSPRPISPSQLSPSQASISPQSIGYPSQPSTSASSNEIRQRPLTPNVQVNEPCPALSGSSSANSFPAIKHLIRRLREDRQMNEQFQSRSISSGLYEFAHMVTPGLPLYEPPMDDHFEFVVSAEERQQQRRHINIRGWGIVAAIGGCILIGQAIGTLITQAILAMKPNQTNVLN